jgi:hypothetical protein
MYEYEYQALEALGLHTRPAPVSIHLEQSDVAHLTSMHPFPSTHSMSVSHRSLKIGTLSPSPE